MAGGCRIRQQRSGDCTQPASPAQPFPSKSISQMSCEHKVPSTCVRTSPVKEAWRGAQRPSRRAEASQRSSCLGASWQAFCPGPSWRLTLARVPVGLCTPFWCQMVVPLRAYWPAASRAPYNSGFFGRRQQRSRDGRAILVLCPHIKN